MSRLPLSLALGLAVFALPQGAPASESEPDARPGRLELSLQEAVIIALESNLELEIAARRVRILEEGLRGARGHLDPTLDVELDWIDATEPTGSELDAGQEFPLEIWLQP